MRALVRGPPQLIVILWHLSVQQKCSATNAKGASGEIKQWKTCIGENEAAKTKRRHNCIE